MDFIKRTPVSSNVSLPIKQDQSLIKQRLVLIFMVIPARVELATYRLGGGCSILLSYGTMSYNNTLYTKIAVLTTAKLCTSMVRLQLRAGRAGKLC